MPFPALPAVADAGAETVADDLVLER